MDLYSTKYQLGDLGQVTSPLQASVLICKQGEYGTFFTRLPGGLNEIKHGRCSMSDRRLCIISGGGSVLGSWIPLENLMGTITLSREKTPKMSHTFQRSSDYRHLPPVSKTHPTLSHLGACGPHIKKPMFRQPCWFCGKGPCEQSKPDKDFFSD